MFFTYFVSSVFLEGHSYFVSELKRVISTSDDDTIKQWFLVEWV